MDHQFDVLIVGAGAVGCAVARELSRTDLHIAVLEKNATSPQGPAVGILPSYMLDLIINPVA